MSRTMQNVVDELGEAMALSMLIVSAGNGSEEALSRLSSGVILEGTFPGEETMACGYARKYVEDCEELGVSAELEYQGIDQETGGGPISRVDVIVGENALEEYYD